MRRRFEYAAVVASLPLLIGCGSLEEPPGHARLPSTSAPQVTAPVVRSEGPMMPGPTAGEKFSNDSRGNRFNLTIYPLQRVDEVVILTAEITLVESKTAQIDTELLAEDDSASKAGARANGFHIVDVAGKKKYLPARTGSGPDSAYCHPGLKADWALGATERVTCYFVDVPAELKEVTVEVSTFRLFELVPIESR